MRYVRHLPIYVFLKETYMSRVLISRLFSTNYVGTLPNLKSQLRPLNGRLHHANAVHDMPFPGTHDRPMRVQPTEPEGSTGPTHRTNGIVKTRKKSDSEETIATDANVAIDTLTDDVMIMIAKKDAGTAIIGTGMNEMILQNMTDDETTGAKGTVIFSEIKSEDFSSEKSVGRQREITT